MNINDLILIYYQFIKDTCNNICYESELRKDLFQEILLIILTYNLQSLLELHSKNQLQYFIIKIIKNNYKSKTSNFYRKYKKRINEKVYKYLKLNEYI
jgi:hypothetical protein